MSTLASPTPPPLPSAGPHHHHPFLLRLHHCNSMPQLKQLHAHAIRTSHHFSDHSTVYHLYTAILRFSAAADPDYARRLLFRSSALPNIMPTSSSFNVLLRCFAFSSTNKVSAIKLFYEMLSLSATLLVVDHRSFPLVLKACAYLFAISEGIQAHAMIFKLGLSADVYVSNSLIHFYASCGRLPECRRIFARMHVRSKVTWNVAVDAHAVNGDYDAAVSLFAAMQRAVGPASADVYALQSLARACAAVGSLSLGLWIHAYAIRNRISDDVLLNNSLVDVYARCGAVDFARMLFERMPVRDVTTYNSMLLGLAMHGRVTEALKLFDVMLGIKDMKPNSVTFVGVLSACNHGGLVEEGRNFFDIMVNNFGIEPQLEHYGCMVDLLSRKGLINEALDLISNMNCKPDAVIWRSLLDSYIKINSNTNLEIGESIARRAIESEQSATSGGFVLLSKVYASANRWNDVGSGRRMMSEEGVKKEPGCSSVEVNGAVHEFVAGDTEHPQTREIYSKLEEIGKRVADTGYTPDSSQAVMVSELRGEKEECLRLHSERLAIAFGLINVVPGAPIRVLKNLRVCRDCHEITKLISRIYGVEIIVRDRLRFHHFKDGECSCMDYW